MTSKIEALGYTDVPEDFSQPDWGSTEKVHDWKNYVPAQFEHQWGRLPVFMRLAIAVTAQQFADNEEWD